jgi:ribosome-binding factor A
LKPESVSRPPCPLTITYVDLSPDLRNASIFFTCLDDLKKNEALKFFETQLHFFKNLIAKQIKLKFVPNILFKIDESANYATRIDKILNNDVL